MATGSETRIWDEPIYCGVDVGRTNDRFAVAKVGMVGDKFRLLHMDLEKNMPFSQQRSHLEDVFRMYPVKRMNIDRTGLGMQLSEEICETHPQTAFGKHFTRPLKEKLALNLLKLCEDNRLILPNDSALLAQLHSIKRKATATGITYDADRDSTGHADGFWALALAVDGLARGDGDGWTARVLS
jgi:phage FluMu gp28-like protein